MAEIDHEALVAMLDRLKLSAIRDQLDTLLDEAARSKMTLREALAFFVSREIARRDERRISMASKLAQFPFVREIDGFEFDAQPSLDPGQIRELATCRWIAHGDTTLLLGPPGTGKTHLAVALGREAIRQNYSVQFVTAATLVAMLAKAHDDGSLDKQLTQLARPKLLIIDELGYLPFEANAAHLFFQLVSRRYEKGSILIQRRVPSGPTVASSAVPAGRRRPLWGSSASWSIVRLPDSTRNSSPRAFATVMPRRQHLSMRSGRKWERVRNSTCAATRSGSDSLRPRGHLDLRIFVTASSYRRGCADT